MKTLALIVLAVFAGYVDEDKEYTLKVTVNGHEAFAGKPEPDPMLILSEFERTRDRRDDTFTRIEIDVAKLLGVEIKRPKEPDATTEEEKDDEEEEFALEGQRA